MGLADLWGIAELHCFKEPSRFLENFLNPLPSQKSHVSHQYLTNVQFFYRQFGCETIHPTKNFTSMNLLQNANALCDNIGIVNFDL